MLAQAGTGDIHPPGTPMLPQTRGHKEGSQWVQPRNRAQGAEALQAQQIRWDPQCWDLPQGCHRWQLLVVPRLPNPPLAKVAPTSLEGPRLPHSALQQRLVAQLVSKPGFHHILACLSWCPGRGQRGHRAWPGPPMIHPLEKLVWAVTQLPYTRGSQTSQDGPAATPPSREPASTLTQLGPPGVGTPAAAGLDKEKPFRSHPVLDVPARNALPALEVKGGGQGTCQNRAGGSCRLQTEVD